MAAAAATAAAAIREPAREEAALGLTMIKSGVVGGMMAPCALVGWPAAARLL